MRRQRPSRTAFQVAAAVVYRALDPRIEALLPRDAAALTEELLRATGLLKPHHVKLMASGWYRRVATAMERHTADGQSLNVLLRKRFIDDETGTAIEKGASQVLVIGGGFDTLTLRLARRHGDVEFFEIDHPATQRAKLRGIAGLEEPWAGIERLPHLRFIAADLAEASLTQVLEDHPDWRLGAPSVVIAEGLLMYLDPTAVDELFATVNACTGPGSRLIFTFMRRDSRGEIHVGKIGLMRGYFKLAGEPLLWGVRDEDELASLLAKHGWRLVPHAERDLRARYLEPAELGDLPLGGVEHIAMAEKRHDKSQERTR